MIDNRLILENSKTLNILYVEDDEEVRKVTVKLFATYFKSIDTAHDGQDGYEKYIQYYKKHDYYYDLVISDIKMPVLNGIEMCDKIKSLHGDQSFIFLTAFDEEEFLHAALNLGVDGFLMKPLDMKQLKKVLYKTSQYIMDKKIAQKHYEQIEEFNVLHINKIDAREYNTPQDIIEDLVEHKEQISHMWSSVTVVQERLKKHQIDVEYFRTHFGIKVIEYFLNVIKAEAEVGNCPVVFVMLDFFKNKNLPLDDIFMICVHFKNSVTSFIFSRYSFNQQLFDSVSLIVDRNFEGVVRNYLKMKECNSKEIKEQQLQEVDKVERVEEEITSYIDYVLEHDLYELQDLEEDIDTLAITVSNNNRVCKDDIVVLGSNIKHYGSILTNYHLFNMLGLSILKLGVSFQENAQILFDSPEKRANITALLEGFVNDLIVWRREIFENNIENPHFLDDSFFSNVDTIIMFMQYDDSAVVSQEEDADIDFFDF